jgi:excisionase family DNA binding protein
LSASAVYSSIIRDTDEESLMPNHEAQAGLDILLDEQEAARLLKISDRTLQAWRVKNVGPAWVKVGRTVRYRRRDLIAWIDLNTCGLKSRPA